MEHFICKVNRYFSTPITFTFSRKLLTSVSEIIKEFETLKETTLDGYFRFEGLEFNVDDDLVSCKNIYAAEVEEIEEIKEGVLC